MKFFNFRPILIDPIDKACQKWGILMVSLSFAALLSGIFYDMQSDAVALFVKIFKDEAESSVLRMIGI